MTVSNVINGHFQRMRPETRAKVEEAIRELNYRRQSVGRGLKLTRHNTIGMLVLSESKRFLAHPFLAEVSAGLSNALAEQGFGLLIHRVRAQEISRSIIVQESRTDGLCVFMSGPTKARLALVDELAALSEPMVLLQENLSLSYDDACQIRQDDILGGKLLARHLVDVGALSFLVVAPSATWPAAADKLRGIRLGLRGRKVQVRLLRAKDESVTTIQEKLQGYLEAAACPDAVIGLNDNTGIAAINTLSDLGFRVPEDVMVANFSAFEDYKYTRPVLTTMRSRAYELGEAAALAMMDRIDRGRFPARHLEVPPELCIGNSTRRARRA